MNKGLLATVVVLFVLIYVTYESKANKSMADNSHLDWKKWESIDEKKNEPISNKASSYEQALEMGKNQKKDIFLFFEADWCSWCKRMEGETLSDVSVKSALEKYIIYYVDTDKEKNVVEKYKINGKGIPASVITNPYEQASKVGIGYMNAEDFIKWLNGELKGNSKKLFKNKTKWQR